MIEMKRGEERFGTVGASENILEASLKALTDGYAYALLHPSLKEMVPRAG
jgi:2-isopropylmalate synthase